MQEYKIWTIYFSWDYIWSYINEIEINSLVQLVNGELILSWLKLIRPLLIEIKMAKIYIREKL